MNSCIMNIYKKSFNRENMARGIIASLFSAFIMSCSGCGGGGGGDSQKAPAPITQAPAPQAALSIVSIDQAPVINLGAAGAWDSVDVLNPSVIQWNGSLNNYYSGYDGTTWRTGLATSSDSGITWKKNDKPVLDIGGWATQYIAANGSAITFNGQVFYFYQGMDAKGTQKIGVATSIDGTNFTASPSPVLDVEGAGTWDDFAVADPYVIQIGNTLYMYYLGMDKTGKQLMGVATSPDGMTWARVTGPILPPGNATDFDANGQGEPAVVYAAPFYYMVYTGRASNEFRNLGWAVSTDGINWTKKSNGLIPASTRQAWDSQVICDPTIMPTGKNDGTYYVWFGGGNQREAAQNLNGQLGRMTIKLN